jgi:hypothetical protein
MKDQYTHLNVQRVLSPVIVSDNTAQVGQVIDSRGYGSVTYVISIGSIADADADFVVLLQEADTPDMAGDAAVEDSNLLGTELLAAFKFDDDNKTRKLGYNGIKRYTRMTITPVNNTSAAAFSCVALLGHPDFV